MEPAPDITAILASWERDPRAALDALAPLVYEELRRMAASYLGRERPGHTLQPTALVHELWLKLAGQPGMSWKDRGHFFGIAARTMRLILVDSARAHFAEKRGGGKRVSLGAEFEFSSEQAGEFLDLSEAIDRLHAWDERKGGVVELKYFGGLSQEEIAAALDVSLGTVKRDLAIAKAFLRRELEGPASIAAPTGES